MTLSIEPGDTFSIFSVKAEMKYLNWKDDKNFLSFSPFIAQVDETKQLLPLGKVPQVIVPEPNSNEPPSKFEELLDKHPVLVPLFAIIAAIVIFFVLIELDTLISKNSTPPTQSSSTAQTITVQ
jgi:hypothetical protein